MDVAGAAERKARATTPLDITEAVRLDAKLCQALADVFKGKASACAF